MKVFIFIIAVMIVQPIFSSSLNQVTGIELNSKSIKTMSVDEKKALVVVFLSAKCPCSDSHIQEIKDLYTDFKNFNFVAVHSNPDEATELTERYFAEANLPFTVLQDENTKLADQFNALKTPHAFVILPSGEIAYQGGVTNSKNAKKSDRKFLREALNDLEKGLTVAVSEGRTLGCSIARKHK